MGEASLNADQRAVFERILAARAESDNEVMTLCYASSSKLYRDMQRASCRPSAAFDILLAVAVVP